MNIKSVKKTQADWKNYSSKLSKISKDIDHISSEMRKKYKQDYYGDLLGHASEIIKETVQACDRINDNIYKIVDEHD